MVDGQDKCFFSTINKGKLLALLSGKLITSCHDKEDFQNTILIIFHTARDEGWVN